MNKGHKGNGTNFTRSKRNVNEMKLLTVNSPPPFSKDQNLSNAHSASSITTKIYTKTVLNNKSVNFQSPCLKKDTIRKTP